ncbi:MAG TPA: hypothetical protein PKE51_09365, partial [Gemmatimonadaceae bacterium]|nr:hypothetical protein [Gemmatimonadaceae bacterium]
AAVRIDTVPLGDSLRLVDQDGGSAFGVDGDMQLLVEDTVPTRCRTEMCQERPLKLLRRRNDAWRTEVLPLLHGLALRAFVLRAGRSALVVTWKGGARGTSLASYAVDGGESGGESFHESPLPEFRTFSALVGQSIGSEPYALGTMARAEGDAAGPILALFKIREGRVIARDTVARVGLSAPVAWGHLGPSRMIVLTGERDQRIRLHVRDRIGDDGAADGWRSVLLPGIRHGSMPFVVSDAQGELVFTYAFDEQSRFLPGIHERLVRAYRLRCEEHQNASR